MCLEMSGEIVVPIALRVKVFVCLRLQQPDPLLDNTVVQ